MSDTPDDPNPVIEPEQQQAPYLLRLFRGDIALATTYWVWGVLISGFGFTALGRLIESNYAQIVVHDYGMAFMRGFAWLSIAFGIFVWIAIWRSAGKYEGSGWGGVARGMVLVGIAVAAVQWWPILAMDPNDDEAILDEVRMMNASLPAMLDNSTRLDVIDFEDRTLFYRHTLVNQSRDDYDVDRFVEVVRESLVLDLCADSSIQTSMEEGITFVYAYVDESGTPVADIPIAQADCAK